MPFFKSNKSQASLDRLAESRESSPTHPEAPTYSQNQSYVPQQQQYDNTIIGNGPTHNLSHQQQSQHPAHILGRSQSNRQSTSPEAFAGRPPGPSVQVTGPASPITHTIPEDRHDFPQTQFGQQRLVHTEKEHKRSKRSIFGFPSKEKEALKSPGQSQVSRRSSILGKISQPQQAVEQALDDNREIPASQYQYSQDLHYPAHQSNQEVNSAATEQYDVQDDPGQSARYDRNPQQQRAYDSPHSAVNAQQEADRGEGQPEYPNPQQYQPTHLDTSESYEAYRRQQLQAGQDPNIQLRPSSQQSLDPPSPSLIPFQDLDSRPSTATDQSRYSTHLAATQPHPQSMPRSEPPNGGLRHHMSQQRDPRSEDPSHSTYSSQTDPRLRLSQQPSEQGRASPAPRTRDDPRQLDYDALVAKHEELLAKYSKVKRYYFDKEAQVTQLQNTVANQRMSMSRTSLDDAQYAARFERLNGAIRDLAFGIRREWTTIPEWLMPVCNQDAHRVGQKEMTAVGRAYISRCIYDNIFYAHFHPGLDMALSGALKKIERSIRRANQTSYMTEEHRDDITTKITNWRLVTMEGLQDDMTNAPERMSQFISFVSSRIIDAIMPMLTHPAPAPLQATLQSGLQMIAELAVGIASNLPIESRDVHVEYFMPGSPIDERFMRMETGIGPLVQPGGRGRTEQEGDDDTGSGLETEEKDTQSIENEIREAQAKATAPRQGSQSEAGSLVSKGSKKSGGIFGGVLGKKQTPYATGSAGSGVARDAGNNEPMEDNDGKIRFAVFLTVDVRGKGGKEGGVGSNVLYKAPCFGYN